MKIIGFHLMPWPYLTPADISGSDSSWITMSNALYDPKKGHELYETYFNQLVYYDEVGFDGVAVNEHHQTPYGLMPSANVTAAMLVPRTKGTIAILGNAIPLHENPLRVAEEIAYLDVVSGGRIISGFVRGIGAEYHSMSMDPSVSRERFYEAHDLIIKAWTEPGPWEWYGRHYKFRYVNTWPRPYQQPHPPIWSPSQGSSETVEWAARNKYVYLQTFSDTKSSERIFGDVREAHERLHGLVMPELIGWSVPVYVGDSDEQALAEAKPHMEYLFNDVLRMRKDQLFPAGYLTVESSQRVMSAKAKGLGTGRKTCEELMDAGIVIVGSADTVRDTMVDRQQRFGFGNFSGIFHFGTLPDHLFRASVKRFADHVMPSIAPLGLPTGHAISASHPQEKAS
jgi:alkanesulfonate monooxygenase SsuD/methylene tetrahydromethanopterin reductase-like flavin-dependent oxidoreductase (luciferase family)